MKFLVSADEHVCLRRKGVDKEFEKNRYLQLFSKLHDIDADVTLHCGDMFDRTPTIEETAMVVQYLNSVNKPTIIIDGNHEATRKGETFLTLLRSMIWNEKVFIVSDITVFERYNLTVIPHCKLSKIPAEATTKYAMTHVRGEIPPHVKPEIDLSLLSGYSFVFAGDLHDRECSQLNILYPGSPLTTHFYREQVEFKGVFLFDTDSDTRTDINLNLPQLIKSTGESIEAGSQDFIVIEKIPDEVAVDSGEAILTKEVSRVDALAEVIPDPDTLSRVVDLYLEVCNGQNS